LIAMCGLDGRERQPVRQLSGAWKQRLALACAIVHRPPLLFLDEPTAAVDPVSRRRFFTTIFSLVREGVTAVVTTHNLEEAEYANRVGMIQDGMLQAIASPAELKRDGSTASKGRSRSPISVSNRCKVSSRKSICARICATRKR